MTNAYGEAAFDPAERDPLVVYRDSYEELPDPVDVLHQEFVVTMPYLETAARLNAARYFANLPESNPDETSDLFAQEDPVVQRRVFELRYGEEELTAQQIMLRAIAESPSQGPDEAALYETTVNEIAREEEGQETVDEAREQLFAEEIDMIVTTVLKIGPAPPKASEVTPRAEYTPEILRSYGPIKRPPLTIGEAEIIEPDDIHKLNLPEFSRPWQEPVAQVINALQRGHHVIVDSRRNSGKTHIFPRVLRDTVPNSWEVSEMTNNSLRGGEGWFGRTTANSFFDDIVSGVDIDEAIAKVHDHYVAGATPHRQEVVGDEIERKILIVDEIQGADDGVLDKLAQWAEVNDTQLILISAIGDQRLVPEVRERLSAVMGADIVNIEGSFERPEYSPEVLVKMLGHLGVSSEIANWWQTDPAAAPLRTMRGLALMYAQLSDVRTYEFIGDARVRTHEQMRQVLMRRREADDGSTTRVIDVLAGVYAGSGQQMVALAEQIDVRPPNYRHIGHNIGITPEDIL